MSSSSHAPFLSIAYDEGINKNVVVVEDQRLLNSKKFVYDTDSCTMKSFQSSGLVDLTLEKDLYVVGRNNSCKMFKSILFCMNSKQNDGVYKYHQKEGKWYRVMCPCCSEFTEYCEGYPQLSHLSNPVDEFSFYRIMIQPHSSQLCGHQMVITGVAYPESTKTSKWVFSPETYEFSEHLNCPDCWKEEKKLDNCLELGAQGLQYRRYHRTRSGSPLLCLAITWFSEHQGVMEYFVDASGNVGKYEFNVQHNCFDLVCLLDFKCYGQNKDARIQRKKPGKIWDDEVDIVGVKHCPLYDNPLFFSMAPKDHKIRKLLFNRTYLQFEQVRCKCCFNTSPLAIGEEKCLSICENVLTGKPIILWRKKDGKIQKREYTCDKTFSMDRSPIRYMEHLSDKEIKSRRDRQVSCLRSQLPYKVYGPSGSEMWSIDPLRNNVVHLIHMNGYVFPYTESYENFPSRNENEYKLREDLCLEQQNSCSNLDSALFPVTHKFCPHTMTHLFVADNESTGTRKVYCFMSGAVRMVRNPCEECLSQPLDSFKTLGTLFSGCMTHVTLSDTGRLQKVTMRGEVLPPSRIKYVTLRPLEFRIEHFVNHDLDDGPDVSNSFASRHWSQEHAVNNDWPIFPPSADIFDLKSLDVYLRNLQGDVKSTVTALKPSDDEDDVESTVTAVEPSDDEDDEDDEDDVESTATALEPSDEEDDEQEDEEDDEDDVESTVTALEPSDDEDVVESVDPVVENQPEVVQNVQNYYNDWAIFPPSVDFFDLESLDVYLRNLQDDVESTVTSLEPSDDEDDVESTVTALEPSDIEDDVESTMTALEPSDIEDVEDDDMSEFSSNESSSSSNDSYMMVHNVSESSASEGENDSASDISILDIESNQSQ